MCPSQFRGGILGAFILFLLLMHQVFFRENFNLGLQWMPVLYNSIVLNVSLLEVLFGKFDLDKNFVLVNHKHFTLCKLNLFHHF